MSVRIVIAGAAGRMGRELVREIAAAQGVTLTGGIGAKGSAELGKDLGTLAGIAPLKIALSDDALPLIAKADALIDFSTPASSIEYAGLCAQARIVDVIGTTGLSDDDNARIKAASRHATIIKSGNMSLGVNLLAGLVAQAAKALPWPVRIHDLHHAQKKDAPSGTALMLGEGAAEARGFDFAEARKDRRIEFSSVRAGEAVGEHVVTFAGQGETIELVHRAATRAIFAKGALQAALWGQGKGPGLFSMKDVLGLV